jgi:hypothetical protein
MWSTWLPHTDIAPQFRDDIPAVLVRQHDVDDQKIKFGRTRLF